MKLKHTPNVSGTVILKRTLPPMEPNRRALIEFAADLEYAREAMLESVRDYLRDRRRRRV